MVIFLRILIPVLLLSVAGSGAWWLIKTKPEPKQRPVPQSVTSVEATRLEVSEYPVAVKTRGVVRPRTSTTLFPEVSGQIIEITQQFREGAFFEKDDLMLKIDPLNYETAIAIAQSNLAQAEAAVAEEQVRGEQALENWKRLGKTGAPSDLVLRKPQLAEMVARARAAEAELKKADRDLKRTEIRAPYAGRVLSQSVDVGQYVSPGTQLAQIFAVDVAEIRLPLTSRQLDFVELPEAYRGEEPAKDGPAVFLQAEIGGKTATWEGRVVRVEGAIDERSRQLFIVAQVDDPYRHTEEDLPPLKIGMYTDAIVQGKVLKNVFVLPRAAVRAGGEVILIDEENRIRRQAVETIWSDRENVIIPAEEGGLSNGDVVCLTPLAFPANGAQVSPIIDGVGPTTELGGKGGGFGKGNKGAPPKGKPQT